MKSETKRIVLTALNILVVISNLIIRELTGADGAIDVVVPTALACFSMA